MLSHRVPRLFPRLALLTILLGLLPPASTPDALASVTRPVASELAAAPVATPPSSGPIARPSGAHSSGLPASSAAGISAQYESHHTLNGVFDGRFATPRAIAAAAPGPCSLSDPANPTTTFVIPAGIYDRVDLDVWARS